MRIIVYLQKRLDGNTLITNLLNLSIIIVLFFTTLWILEIVLLTSVPAAVVVSGSMTHDYKFDEWWLYSGEYYANNNITKEHFEEFRFKNGINKGDILISFGLPVENVKVGDTILYRGDKTLPIVHRVVRKSITTDDVYYFQTRGDYNLRSDNPISEEQYIGTVYLKIPYVGYAAIAYREFIRLF